MHLTRFLLTTVLVIYSVSVPLAHSQSMPATAQTDFYFAHITDGGSDDEKWTTQIRFVNSNPFAVSGNLQFYSQDGTPLLVDLGGGSFSSFGEPVPAFGSLLLETKGTSPVLRTGFAKGTFDAPVQATAEFRLWKNGRFGTGVSVDGISPNTQFVTFADSSSGIAVANPNSSAVSCTVQFLNASGFIVKKDSISLGPLNQTAFVLGSRFALPDNSTGSAYVGCSQPVASLAIAGNKNGITGSMPSGAFAVPSNQQARIQRLFKHLVKVLNAVPNNELSVGQVNLRIGSSLILNASAITSSNLVFVELAVAELLADSDSELAYVIAHELGHIFQASKGLQFYASNRELDADRFAVVAALWAGYDPYAGAGALGKLAMVTVNTSINAQLFDNLTDPHTSFSNRMGSMYSLIVSACSSPDWDAFCSSTRNTLHPHMPTPLGVSATQ
ncbi:MAG: M48 family metalloprotease [Acidobacteria bacterium]|nr:M48 family metalloprotease [Acidobacteriota bacterium]